MATSEGRGIVKNQWMNFFNGTVKIKINGRLIEQFINHVVKEKMEIWNIRRHGHETVTCYVKLEDVKKLRHIIRNFECKFVFLDRKGLPFFLRKMLLNSGFAMGFVLCLFVIFLLSNMVWNISIEGANPKVEYEIQNQLTDMGIKTGAFHFTLPSVSDIQRELTERVDSITWVGVDLKGTNYHLQVVEKTTPEETGFVNPRHLVAKKKGVIYDYFIEEGQPLIEVNDFVNKGDLLVSGIIGKEGKTEIVAAKGSIYAEIWYKSLVSVPLKTSFQVYTGEYKTKHYIDILNYKVPFWGFGNVEFNQTEMEYLEKNLRFFKWTLPITYVRNIIREKEDVERVYTKAEAKTLGLKMARSKLEDSLPERSTIKGKKVLHEASENGKVKLMIHFQVIEDIASEQPIIQGD